MPATINTNSHLASGGIVCTQSSLQMEPNNLAVVAAEFVMRDADWVSNRNKFYKGAPPPTAISVDLTQLQLRQVYMTDFSVERARGLATVACNFAGAKRFTDTAEIPLQISYNTRIITRSITTEGTPAYYEISGDSGLNIGGRIAADQVSGRGIWLGTSGRLRYVPERPSRTITRLRSVYAVYTFSYSYAICFGLDIPELSHSVQTLVRPSGGQHPYLDPGKDWVVVASENVNALNKAVVVYEKTFTAEKYRD